MNLEIDVGNTSLKWRVLDAGCVVARGRELTSAGKRLSGVNFWSKLKTIAVSNVSSNQVLDGVLIECSQRRPDIAAFVAASQARFNGVVCAYGDPSCLGVDRWLAIIAGYLKYKEPCCVVDCGSAITVDLINAAGVHQGGYIVPGFALMRRSLSLGTDGVAFGELDRLDIGYGASTTECVNHGINYMVVAMIEGVFQRMKIEGAGRLLLTGGDAGRVADICGGELCPDLVLDGLSLVSDAVSLP